MDLIKVKRYFRTVKHPLGEGLYLKIESEFDNQEDADNAKHYDLNKDGIEVVEISEEEYLENTKE
ncbi:hypothetical protein UMC2_35711 [[Clostridium] sordellii]|uniref:hypothetical protein n=1 Tax=Paraclostridium sordellii TaxID=1505 RepID=UPI000542F119|nr:hypothetical protein [Paeniclostridium sordellii]CEK34360.1 hypothetical protein UMC2_35711 [[Clostridium] sordellii] [Paeniclostridium sordellii]